MGILGLEWSLLCFWMEAPKHAGQESLAAWSRMVQVQVHHMMVHSAAHLPLKAAHDFGFCLLLLLDLYTASHILSISPGWRWVGLGLYANVVCHVSS